MVDIDPRHLKEVPNLWSVTRSTDRSTLVYARDSQEALAKYNRLVRLCPDLGFPEESLEAVRSVVAVV